MANHQSAIKKQRRDEKKRQINKTNLSKMRNKIKLLKKKADAGEKETVQKIYREVVSTIDHTVSKGTIHKKTGARYKSRISSFVNKAVVES